MINIFVGISNEWAEYQKLWEFVTPVTLTIFQIHHLKWHLFTIYNFTFTFAIVFLPNGFILTSKAHKYSARLRMFVNFTVSMVPMAFLYAICSCSTILKNGVVHAQRTRTKHIYIFVSISMCFGIYFQQIVCVHAGVFKWFGRFCCSMLELEFVISMRVEWNLLRIRNTLTQNYMIISIDEVIQLRK